MLYAEKLKYLREENNLTQKDLANILGIERGLYSQYETEYFIIPVKHLNTLCSFFHVSFDYLFGFSDYLYDSVQSDINIHEMSIRLKSFRKENHFTQLKLANILNVSQATIVKYENQKSIIATPFLYTICKKYRVSADYLLGKINNPKYIKPSN